MQTSTSAGRYGIAMAGNVVRSRQDFSGQYRSEGPQFVGSTINTEGGPFYLTSDSMSDAVVVPSVSLIVLYRLGEA